MDQSSIIYTSLNVISAERGMPIALYITPEATSTSNAPEVMATYNTHEATTHINECWLALSAVVLDNIYSDETST